MMFSLLLLLSSGQIGTPSAQLLNPSALPSSSAQLLDERVQGLQRQINKVRVGWGGGAIALTAVGFSLCIGLVLGIPLLVLGLRGAGALLSLVIFFGVVFTALGSVGLVMAFIGIVEGINTARNARDVRDDLIRQRDELMAQGPQRHMTHQASDPLSSLATLVTF
jgi:hypothetical protein